LKDMSVLCELWPKDRVPEFHEVCICGLVDCHGGLQVISDTRSAWNDPFTKKETQVDRSRRSLYSSPSHLPPLNLQMLEGTIQLCPKQTWRGHPGTIEFDPKRKYWFH
jgi:hypothetical protein